MYVVITTELTGGGRASRTCDLFDLAADAVSFARSMRRDLEASGRSGIIQVHQLDLTCIYYQLTARGPAKPTRKRGCRR